jgi:hypothetical protein
MSEIRLKPARGADGRTVPGLWESDVVRMERVDGGWCFQVPARQVGQTNYLEFRPVAIGGKWRDAGWRKTRAACCHAAEKLKAGICLIKPAHGRGEDRVPAVLVDWTDVAEEIAQHPSVKGLS